MKIELSTVEKVPFHGDMIEVARINGEGYAHLKAMCQSLGIDHDSQRKKLNGYSWGRTVIITVRDEYGCPHRLTMISLDAVPMWLATIHPSKVAFAVRSKLESYQLEAAKVLAAWFNGPAAERVARMEALDREAIELRGAVAVLRGEVAVLRGDFGTAIKMIMVEKIRGDQFERRLDAVTKPFAEPAVVYVTLAKYHAEDPILDIAGRPLGDHHMAGMGRSMTAFSKTHGVSTRKVAAPNGRLVNAYSYGLLQLWRAKQDERRGELKREYVAPAKQLKLFAS